MSIQNIWASLPSEDVIMYEDLVWLMDMMDRPGMDGLGGVRMKELVVISVYSLIVGIWIGILVYEVRESKKFERLMESWFGGTQVEKGRGSDGR